MRYALATLTLVAGLAVGCSNDKMTDTSSPRGGGNALDVDTPDRAANATSGSGRTAGGAGGVGTDPVVGSAGGTGPTTVLPPAELNRTNTTSPAGQAP